MIRIGRVILKVADHRDPIHGFRARFQMVIVTENGQQRFAFFEADRSRMPGIAWVRMVM